MSALRRRTDDLASALRRAFVEAVLSADPARAIGDVVLPRGRRNLIVAAGKAAATMARGALEQLRGSNVFGVCVVTDASPTEDLAPLEIVRAAHPLPDARSHLAAVRALDLARTLERDDHLIALISGGASSLLAAPPIGKTLQQKADLLRCLIHSGVSIRTLNLVRRHISEIKGGRLARAAGRAHVSTLAVSDVIGGSAEDIGSGPTVPGGADADAVKEILYRACPALAADWVAHVEEPVMPRDLPTEPTFRFIGGPQSVAAEIAARLSPLLVAAVGDGEGGDVRAVAARRVAQAWALAPGHALVIPCEPTVKLPDRTGAGGRAGLVAWMAARELPPDGVLLCGATDGVDGTSGGAGAIVTRYAAHRSPGASIDSAIARFDDAPLHRAAGTDLRLGPSPTNVSDVHIVARCAPRG